MMKAAVCPQYGPPEVVQIRTITKPSPNDNEVLIKVHATTVNRTDCGFRSAEYFIVRFFGGMLKPKNPVLGNEFAGEVAAIGKNVTKFTVGQRVFGYDDKTFGSHAEYKVMSEDGAMATIPEGFSYTEAAALTEGSHYALCDIRAAKVTADSRVLVNGATGAIGSAAVQLLKYFGADVTAVCATPHLALVKSLGADEVIDYTQQDFTTMRMKKFDLIFDAVGKSSFRKCKPQLKDKGAYISTELGPRWENPFLALQSPLRNKRVLFPIPTITKDHINFLKELAEQKRFTPVIDRTYRLDEIVEAYRYVETGMKTGNVVVLP